MTIRYACGEDDESPVKNRANQVLFQPNAHRTNSLPDARRRSRNPGRLPEELWERLRAVHFNDRSWGRRWGGYVNTGHREIAICASSGLGELQSLDSRKQGCSPATFGASRGRQWPRLAVRRFLLYNVFLHELGHLQIVVPSAKRVRRRFASETHAQKFANRWRRALVGPTI